MSIGSFTVRTSACAAGPAANERDFLGGERQAGGGRIAADESVQVTCQDRRARRLFGSTHALPFSAYSSASFRVSRNSLTMMGLVR